mmetsp:Transcript_11230/g.23994  ORF Transcript_11230/g.23994 Transcript_11230/m.23994 type:complete len:463 (+) Transcript_11230:1341-2729(+)
MHLGRIVECRSHREEPGFAPPRVGIELERDADRHHALVGADLLLPLHAQLPAEAQLAVLKLSPHEGRHRLPPTRLDRIVAAGDRRDRAQVEQRASIWARSRCQVEDKPIHVVKEELVRDGGVRRRELWLKEQHVRVNVGGTEGGDEVLVGDGGRRAVREEQVEVDGGCDAEGLHGAGDGDGDDGGDDDDGVAARARGEALPCRPARHVVSPPEQFTRQVWLGGIENERFGDGSAHGLGAWRAERRVEGGVEGLVRGAGGREGGGGEDGKGRGHVDDGEAAARGAWEQAAEAGVTHLGEEGGEGEEECGREREVDGDGDGDGERGTEAGGGEEHQRQRRQPEEADRERAPRDEHRVACTSLHASDGGAESGGAARRVGALGLDLLAEARQHEERVVDRHGDGHREHEWRYDRGDGHRERDAVHDGEGGEHDHEHVEQRDEEQPERAQHQREHQNRNRERDNVH